MDDSQENNKCDMILGGEIFSELKIDLCFSNNTIRGNRGTYKGCTSTNKIREKYQLQFEILMNSC